MLSATTPQMAMMLDPNITMQLWQAASYPGSTPAPVAPTTAPSILSSSTTTYLPWLLGAGVLAYLIFFRKKG
jgi:hypothetical protein